jgi:hypothetical protein
MDSSGGTIPGTTGAVDPSSAWPIAGTTGIAQGVGAGQYGMVPSFAGSASIGGAVTSVWAWLNKPFTQPLAPLAIFGIVGSILIAIILWNLILYHIRIAAEAI